MSDPVRLRRAIMAAPLEISNSGEQPETGTLYVPPGHTNALQLEASVVVGGRGVGKSFWAAALRSEPLRQLLGSSVPDLGRAQVHIGFSERGDINSYPDEATFTALLGNFQPYDIWRAVILRWLASKTNTVLPPDWHELINWMQTQTQDAAQLIESSKRHFAEPGQYGLIVFDALDRTSHDWRSMDEIVRGLLRAVLWLRSYPWLRAKVFLRSDQFERTVTDFPDASKIKATREELRWGIRDLHGMLWQRLINAPNENGVVLRDLYIEKLGNNLNQQSGSFHLPDSFKREQQHQQALFEALAGRWVGNDRRRGATYTWAVGHLADSSGQTSPRSFVAAIREAAAQSEANYSEHPRALHYESIKQGIQKASKIRVSEIAEDYPWVSDVVSALAGLTVPCEFEPIVEQWKKKFPAGPTDVPTSSRLPPQHAERGWDGIRDDLIRLGVLERMHDGRVNMPDLYRVGFGLGRRGGVRPTR